MIPMTGDDERSKSYYLRHVRIGQVLPELKGILLYWALLSSASIALIVILDLGTNAVATLGRLDRVPKLVWICLGLAWFTWVIRGETIAIPKFSFKKWLLFNIAAATVLTGTAFLRTSPITPYLLRWAFAPLFWAVFVSGPLAFNKLARLGRSNYEISD
jgi:hypothetical protein